MFIRDLSLRLVSSGAVQIHLRAVQWHASNARGVFRWEYGSRSEIVWRESAAMHRLPGRAVVLRGDVKESAHPFGLKDDAAPVLVGLHQIIEARAGEQLLQAQRLVQLLGDVEECQFVLAEMD